MRYAALGLTLLATLSCAPLLAQDAAAPSQTAPAQPPAPAAQPTVAADMSTPEKTAQTLLNAFFHSDFQTAARCVSGAVYNDSLKQLEAMMRQSPPPATLELSLVDPQAQIDGDKATLTCKVKSNNPSFPAPPQECRVNLVREGDDWKIMTPSADEITKATDEQRQKMLQEDAIRSLALVVRYPDVVTKGARQAARATVSLSNAKQLALGCIMLVQDYDEVFKITPATFEKAVMPYVKNKSIFTSPYDAPGTVSYKFNPKLANLSLAKIPDPARTVMLYEGEWGKPSFRNNDKAVIAFADGHAKLITRAEAANLVWTPNTPPAPKKKTSAKRRKS